VCSAVVCAAAVLMAALILLLSPVLLLPLGAHRLEEKTSHPRASTTVAGAMRGAETAEPAVRARAVESYGKLPLSFEANQGQTDRQVKFLSRGGGYSLFLTSNEAVLALRKSNSNGKKQMAKGKNEFQRSPFDSPRSLLERPASFQFPVSNFQTPATNNEPRTTDAVLHMKLVGANPNPKIVGMNQLPGKSNYFIGNDPKKWRTNVPNYAKVKYANVYPGVDLVYYGNQGQVEYDFVVRPGADPYSIQLAIVSDEQVGSRQKAVGNAREAQDLAEGQSAIDNRQSSIPTTPRIDAHGDLVVGTDGGEVIFHKPVVYQLDESRPSSVVTRQLRSTKDQGQGTKDGGKHYVDGRYVLRSDQSVAFQVAFYDPAKPLVIDPVLAYSTYLGGRNFDQSFAIAVDTLGNSYVIGIAGGPHFPHFPTTPGAFQTVYGGGNADAFISKLNASGSALLYSTYLGGLDDDIGSGIAVDAWGNAYVAGGTLSFNFPTTPGAFQTTYGGNGDAFVSKLNSRGSALLYSTYLGGSSGDGGSGIAVDASGNVYVTGGTASSDFPTTSGAFQTTFGGVADVFVSKLNAFGSALLYSTYLGGSGGDSSAGIKVDASGNAYAIGLTSSSDFPTTSRAFQTIFGGQYDAFISKLNSGGTALLYSTYLGGRGYDTARGVAVDNSGSAYVTGDTRSVDFPVSSGAFQTTYGRGDDAFVSKLNAAGSALLYSTYLGGSGQDVGFGIAVAGSGNAYVTGSSAGRNFPTTADAFQTTVGRDGDAFVTKLNAAGSALLYSSYLGGSDPDWGAGIAIDASGNAYITGSTGACSASACSDNFPTTPGAFQTTHGGGSSDAFVARISFANGPGIALGPGGLTFGTQAVGTTSAPQAATLLAAGSLPLSITSIVASGDFAQTNTCGSGVPNGTTCTISVTFTPTATGTRTGAVTITDNAAGSPHKLLLSGTGVSSFVNLAPASVPFIVLRTVGTTSPPQTVKLTNVGSAEINITGITLTGPDPGDFAQSDNCLPTVAVGGSCLITVTFKPTMQGMRTASVTITDNVPGSPQTVPLSGRGTFLHWSPRQMNLGDQPVGTSSPAQTVVLTNAGTAPIALFSIGIGGVNAADFTETNTCGSSLKAGASCTIEVTFTPTAVGGRIGHVAIQDNAFGGTHWVGLLGKGT
jgi:hypothetical protein